MTPQERIESLSIPEPNTGCWLWLGAVHEERHGRQYGRLTVNGRTVGAHRYSYQIFRGAIPEGFEVCHHCDTPPCVNPVHLFAGTKQDNVDDREAKGRNNHTSKLSPQDVAAVRLMHKSGVVGYLAIARLFNVSKSSARDIIKGVTWRNVPTAPGEMPGSE